MFRGIGAPEIILILVVLLLLFGAKRLPDLSRSMGRSLRIFKSEVKDLTGDEDDPGAKDGDADQARADGDADRPRSSEKPPAERSPRELEGTVHRADPEPGRRVAGSEPRER
jgi:sec-independent protein translocase protein TatA